MNGDDEGNLFVINDSFNNKQKTKHNTNFTSIT